MWPLLLATSGRSFQLPAGLLSPFVLNLPNPSSFFPYELSQWQELLAQGYHSKSLLWLPPSSYLPVFCLLQLGASAANSSRRPHLLFSNLPPRAKVPRVARYRNPTGSKPHPPRASIILVLRICLPCVIYNLHRCSPSCPAALP